MLSVDIDEKNNIAILEPDGPLSKNDFELATLIIDSHIEKTHQLNGLLIHSKSFPGWRSFTSLSSHLQFIKDHHKKILRIAFATDSLVFDYAKVFAKHFVNAKIKLFPFSEFEQAKKWASGDNTL